MNKNIKIIIVALVVVLVLVVAGVLLNNSGSKSNLPNITSAETLETLVTSIYEGMEEELPMLQTQVLDVTDNSLVNMFTGLENGSDLEYLVASEPMMTSQAYSLILVKVKDGVNANEIAKTMCENIDQRKWICVSAEKVYATSSGNIACLVMSNEKTAKTVYEKFKTLAGSVGKEYEKTEQTSDLPEEMY